MAPLPRIAASLVFLVLQVQEILKLLYELLPTSSNCEDVQEGSEKQAFLTDNPVFVQRLGMEILPLLIQVGDLS